ncbi:ras GTPase-activating protein 4-like isoform X3 [Passer domesticus]|uniref:ras GTPase-activating protein 4-like isoform X3 n=1 Tax=Passer domesticus TaxID=48849 RepID=UPI0030FE598B
MGAVLGAAGSSRARRVGPARPRSAPLPPAMARRSALSIRIVEGKNLPAKDITGSSDPYCIVKIDDEAIIRTATVWKTLSPFWGEEYEVQLQPGFHSISIYVMDEDALSRDDIIGKVCITRDMLAEHPKGYSGWMSLSEVDPDEEVQGEIHLRVEVLGSQGSRRLRCSVLEARDLARKDRNGASDPFVRLRYNGKTQESTVSVVASACPACRGAGGINPRGSPEPPLSPSLVSLRDRPTQQEGTKLWPLQVVKKSCYPRWNETFEFELAEPAGEKLCVEVWDWDLVGRNDFLGKVVFSVQGLEVAGQEEGWFRLCPDKSKPTEDERRGSLGSLQLQVKLRDETVLPSHCYQPLVQLLCQEVKSGRQDGQVHLVTLLDETTTAECRQEVAINLVKLFLGQGLVKEFLDLLFELELAKPCEPNTLFRSNSLASKSMESFLKVPHHPKPALPSSSWPWAVPRGRTGWAAVLVPSPGGGRLEKIHWVTLGVSVPNLWPIPVPCGVPRQVTGMPYLHFVLGPTIARVFEEKKYVELDPGKVEIKDVGCSGLHRVQTEGEVIEQGRQHLQSYLGELLDAIVRSAPACPPLIRAAFRQLFQRVGQRFPQHQHAKFVAVTSFLCLRFFSPAVMTPKLFQLRATHADARTSRTLLLLAKAIQLVGNMEPAAGRAKEPWLSPLLPALQEGTARMRDFITRLVGTEEERGEQEGEGRPLGPCPAAVKEGLLLVHKTRGKGPLLAAAAGKKLHFCLTGESLSFAKSPGAERIGAIALGDILAAEKVEEKSFGSSHVMQVVYLASGGQQETAYLQCKCVNELNQWLSALRKVCGNNPRLLRSYHPGVFRGDKWSCCHQRDRTGLGCDRTRHGVTLQDWSDPLEPTVEAQRLFQHLQGLRDTLRDKYWELLEPERARSGQGAAVPEALSRLLAALAELERCHRRAQPPQAAGPALLRLQA